MQKELLVLQIPQLERRKIKNVLDLPILLPKGSWILLHTKWLERDPFSLTNTSKLKNSVLPWVKPSPKLNNWRKSKVSIFQIIKV
jgi:hypothetical protein